MTFPDLDNDHAIGTRWLDTSTGNCYERRDFGWKFIGISNNHLPFPEVEITGMHDNDIYNIGWPRVWVSKEEAKEMFPSEKIFKELCYCGNPHEIVIMELKDMCFSMDIYVKCECDRYVKFTINE